MTSPLGANVILAGTAIPGAGRVTTSSNVILPPSDPPADGVVETPVPSAAATVSARALVRDVLLTAGATCATVRANRLRQLENLDGRVPANRSPLSAAARGRRHPAVFAVITAALAAMAAANAMAALRCCCWPSFHG